MAILIVSNGHGEDLLASVLAEELKKTTKQEILAFPLVGEGLAYDRVGIRKVHSQPLLPSGGFVYLGWENLKKDISSGLFKQLNKQKKVLRSLRGIRLAICVGDTYNLFFTSRYLKTEIVFIPTAKSNYIKPHTLLDRLIMRKALVVLPRDEVTAVDLRKRRVKANCLGNLMMDAISKKDIAFNVKNPIGVLPGSRQDASKNLEKILQVIEKTKVRDDYLVALTEDFDVEDFLKKVSWEEADLKVDYAAMILQKDSKRVYLCKGIFGDIIFQSDFVIGLSGTGNEQAAGLGKPVLTFVGPGAQFTPYFAKKQKKLLGDAVCFVEENSSDEEIAKRVDYLALQPTVCTQKGAVGIERMGKAGAAQKMAILIGDIIKREVVS